MEKDTIIVPLKNQKTPFTQRILLFSLNGYGPGQNNSLFRLVEAQIIYPISPYS